jgi:hypothetical protein
MTANLIALYIIIPLARHYCVTVDVALGFSAAVAVVVAADLTGFALGLTHSHPIGMVRF